MSARRFEAKDEARALEEFHRKGWTDGLPVVIPTPERVEEMVVSSGLDGDLVLGRVGPSDGDATVEKVAVNAVMAGCLPEHFPVVMAAVRAACDERFDLGTMQATTHAIGPVIIVNGPARQACGGIASGWGALGPGHRANASIGRALRLVMINIGGARPGTTDMSVLGQPGKFTHCCFAEAEESSAFPPLHVSRGFRADQSVVTLVGAEAPHSVIATPSGDDPEAAERVLRTLAGAIANAGSNNTYGGNSTQLVVLNPVHSRILAKRYTREGVQQRLHELAVTPRRVLDTYAPAGKRGGDPEKLIHAIRTPQNVVIAVAGGEGIYSAVFNSWGGGAHGVETVSCEIELNQYCELPSARA